TTAPGLRTKPRSPRSTTTRPRQRPAQPCSDAFVWQLASSATWRTLLNLPACPSPLAGCECSTSSAAKPSAAVAEDQLHQATTVKSPALLLVRNHLGARRSDVALLR